LRRDTPSTPRQHVLGLDAHRARIADI
jgi:hypothetical protein